MITQVNVTNDRGTVLQLPLSGVGLTYPVKDISGLGPGKATLDAGKYGTALTSDDFRGYQGERRNIVLTLGLEPNYATQTVASIRKALYSWFTPLSYVKLEFVSDDMATVQIAGWVESAEPSIFAQEPDMQISIICPIGYFTDPVLKTASGAGTADTTTRITVPYNGTIRNGFLLELTLTSPMKYFVISNNSTTDEVLSIVYSSTTDMPGASTAKVSTIPGSKYAVSYSASWAGGQLSLLSYIDPANDTWPLLRKGDNLFSVRVASGEVISYTLKYYELYGGL
jgi:hypothetical protein